MNPYRTISRARYRAWGGDGGVRGAESFARFPLADGTGLVPARGRAAARLNPATSDSAAADSPTQARRSCVRIEGGRLLPPELRGAVIALGNFDGFHIGHQAVVGRAVKMARDRGVAAIVATFDPHPVGHFNPNAAPFRLTTLDQLQRMFAAAGVDAMMVVEFNGALAEAPPEDFVHRWLAGAGGVVTGSQFCFGRMRAGTVGVLAELAMQRGMAYEAVDAVVLDDEVVSSTRIRRALRLGDCESAEMLLTRPFALCGNVHRGRPAIKSGCRVGTIELGDYLRPLAGDYAALLRLPDGRSFGSTARFGSADGDGPRCDGLSLATPGLWEEIHGQSIQVDLLRRLPPPIT